MKSRLALPDGRTITVQPLPHSKAVLVQSHDPHAGSLMHLLIPADMAGAFAQALERAAAATAPAPVSDAARLAAESFAIGLGVPA